LPNSTRTRVSAAIEAALRSLCAIEGISSLAEGADQVFAQTVLDRGGRLIAVIPSAGYSESFETAAAEADYWALRSQAEQIVELPFSSPTEEAYWAAGKEIVARSDVLYAVWDGKPSGGLGGTADVVAFAAERGVATSVLWPAGSTRE
jgi:hypothetical protein